MSLRYQLKAEHVGKSIGQPWGRLTDMRGSGWSREFATGCCS